VIVYGRNPVREALRGPRVVSRVWATKNAAREPWLGEAPIVTIAAADELERLSGSDAHQGICAEVAEYRYADESALLHGTPDAPLVQGSADAPFLVALDQVTDPQNLGAICRTAECAGVTGVVLPERRSAHVTPAVCKASAGAVEHLQIAQVRNLADWLAEAKAAGLWCYGADADGEVSYEAVDWAGGVVVVLGSEGRGLRPRVAAACDVLVSLPLRGRIESLSVSAAAAVLLYSASAAVE
jgi:23S rRNA (guanosine2251-2'-O)-methyltransferase